MSIITVDIETYYDKEYSLSKMTTEEYINDPRFEVIGVGVKVDDQESVWYTGDQVAYVLKNLDWSDHAVLCHNTMFDGAILAWKYGIEPGFWFDTLSMARAIHGVDAGGSLKVLAERYKLGVKGDEVVNALGKRLVDFDQVSLERYGAYCRNDVDLTYQLFGALSKNFPDSELQLIDLTLRMYTQPSLRVDDGILLDRLEEVRTEQSNLLRGLMTGMGVASEEEVRTILSSNPKFADMLKRLGVEPPTKISKTTGKEAFAFAKTDEGFLALQEHPDPFIQELCRVRLGTKSTIEESRIERFIDIGARNRGFLPVPLRYYGAHTGRWSGLDSVNFQNLPSRDKKKKTLKNSVVAPDGHVVINSDSSQIEARVLAWLAGQTDLVKQFRNGEDVYSTFASKVYGFSVSKANPIERFVGKTCILGLGYGTGAAKLQHTLKLGGAVLDLDKCNEIVDLYRNTNSNITRLWRDADATLDDLVSWPFDEEGGRTGWKHLGNESLRVDPTGIRLPNGLYIRYRGITNRVEDKKTRKYYTSRKGEVGIWGGGVVENVVQALARIIISEQMLKVSERYHVALTVHDAIVIVVPESERDEAIAFVTDIMSTPSDWCSTLPVACEVKWGRSYGEC